MKAALEGIKVIDLSRILAGPWASQLLADMGAEVIKIEHPKYGDDTRRWGPPFIGSSNEKDEQQAAYFHCANRNKQSIAIDITCKQGQQVVKELISQADVVIENFKVGGLQKYGLDYPSLKALNPKLIYCSITGFGQSGPCAHKAGYDAMIQAQGGLMSLTGEIDGEPMKTGVAVVDIFTGLYASNAILAALFSRERAQSAAEQAQGQAHGQYIDIALLDVQVATLANQGMNYLATGNNPQRFGNAHPNIVPYQSFATQDGCLLLAIGNDSQFEKFCQVANCQALAQDPRFYSNTARVEHRNSLIPLLATVMAKQSTNWWLVQLEKIAVPCGPVNTVKQALNHEQVQHRQMIKTLPNADGELIKTIASPINMSATPLQYRSASPNLGQHSVQVLKQNLAYSDDDIEQLFHQGVVK